MRILHVTDLHMNPQWLVWVRDHAAEYDLTCFTGDILDMRLGDSADGSHGNTMTEQARKAQDWLARFPAPLWFTSGNHECYPVDEMDAEQLSHLGFVEKAVRANRMLRTDGADCLMADIDSSQSAGIWSNQVSLRLIIR